MKGKLFASINRQAGELVMLSDKIHDHPELGQEEYLACGWLTDYLKTHGFVGETGVGGFPTAFRAEYQNGEGGPTVGLLCEYDALEGIGHGCGHHMQGPAIVGAAVALKECLSPDNPCRIVVYGTPAEETIGAKVSMLKSGCFRELDIALMTHATGTGTSVDNKLMALSTFDVIYHGFSSHAAIAPDRGKSAMDAMLLSFQGLEFLREHIPDDIRIHYCIPEAIRPVNAVPARAVGSYAFRGYRREVLDGIIARFQKIVEGAALMTDTTYEIIPGITFDNAIAVESLRKAMMENAALVGAPRISPPREKTGSSDFGNILYAIPGACIRIDCGCAGMPSHSIELAAVGTSESFHQGMLLAAKILAATAWDFVGNGELRRNIQYEFSAGKDGK